MNYRLVSFILIATVLACLAGCQGEPSFAVKDITLNTGSLVGGTATLLTCEVEAVGAEIPPNGHTSWHVSRGLLYVENQIQDGKPGQNVMGRSAISDTDRSVYYIPPREGGEITITVRFKESEPFSVTLTADEKPDV